MSDGEHAAFYYSVKKLIRIFETSHGPIDYNSAIDEKTLSKRRIYDVISIFVSTNVVIKEDKSTITWQGYGFFKKKYQLLIEKHHINDEGKMMVDIIPSLDSISMEKLTEYYLLFFPAMKIETLKIRDVCEFLCREKGNFATIMCKVYQLTSVLSAMDIIFKTENSGEFRLSPEYIFSEETKCDPLPIETLLNRPGKCIASNIYEKRRNEFNRIAKEKYHHQWIYNKIYIYFQYLYYPNYL